jgi:hypothetical protein
LNPSAIPSVNSSEKTPRHHVIASFQTNCILCRRNDRYIPTKIFCRYIPIVSPTDLGRRYIPTDFETELFSSGIITDEKIPLVIPLVFSGFLVVIKYGRMKLGKKTKEKPQVNPSYYDKPVT